MFCIVILCIVVQALVHPAGSDPLTPGKHICSCIYPKKEKEDKEKTFDIYAQQKKVGKQIKKQASSDILTPGISAAPIPKKEKKNKEGEKMYKKESEQKIKKQVGRQ